MTEFNREELAEKLLINYIDHNAFHLFDEVCSIKNELSAFYVEEVYSKEFSDSTKLREEALRGFK